MNWKLIKSGTFSGKKNMDIDLSIAKNLSPNEAYFRLYRWKPFCISLGANQNESDINQEKTKQDNIEVVKRPTGGRAILHAEEWTYCSMIPLTINLTPHQIYEKISLALIRGLVQYESKLKELLQLEEIQPDFKGLLKQPIGTLCFASTAKSEIKYNGKKLVGSAQRKLGNAILQHGSVLIGKYHRKLPEYINATENECEFLKTELVKRTTELETILKQDINYSGLEQCLISGFEKEWNIRF